MIDPERIALVPTCDSCREHYDARLEEWRVGSLRMCHGWFSVWFPEFAGELLCHERVGGAGQLVDDAREHLLLRARRILAGRLDRAPALQVGQRVRYELGPPGSTVGGEGTIVRQPLVGAYWPAAWRYRVRHDGGTATAHVEVGALEHELRLVAAEEG